jgi:glyoxylase I family protein
VTEPSTAAAPAITGVNHFSPTVSDVEASAAWYERVFGMNRARAHPHAGLRTSVVDAVAEQ